MIWHLPEQDADYSNRWKILKTAFSRQIPGTALPMDRVTYGSRDFGSMPFATRQIISGIWITSITTPSNMAGQRRHAIGRTVHFSDMSVEAGTRKIGA